MLTVNEFNAINKKKDKKEEVCIFDIVKEVIANTPVGKKTETIHMQMIKHMAYCNKHNIYGEDFCKRVGISSVWGREFTKMRKIHDKLVEAGLDCSLI